MTHSKSKHDPFFSRTLEHPAIAQAFFRQHLPDHLKVHVDFDSFIRVDRTNTDAKLKRRHRDIIYKAYIKTKDTLFACAEHQSGEDFMMPVRLLRYDADALETYLKEHQKWPLVINLVFYHGEKSPYPYPSEADGYYEHPIWGSQELSIRFHVIDISQLSDGAIIGHGLCAPMELLLKHGREGNFELPTAAYQQVFQDCIAEVGEDYIIAMLTYGTGLSNKEVGKKIFNFIEKVLTDKKDLIMTYAQQLRQEGMQQGMQQGMQEGMQQGMQQGMQTRNLEIAKEMLLNLHLGMDIVQKATGLSKEELNKLK